MTTAPLDYFALFSEDCLRCSHLVDTNKKGMMAFATCHYSKGNTHCPAKEVRVVIVGKAHAMAERVMAARLSRNAVREAKLLAAVGKQSDSFKTLFYSHLEKL